MSQIWTRVARVDDAHEIATIQVKTQQVAYRGLVPDDYLDNLVIEDRTEVWHAILAALEAPDQTFVAICDDAKDDGSVRSKALVGYCSVGRHRVDPDEKLGEVYSLYVLPQAMNQGAGSMLMEIAQQYLVAQGFERASLWVLASNQRARHFYENRGWRHDGETRIEEISNAGVLVVKYIFQY